MTHSYEELRAAALDILAGRENSPYEPSQVAHLEIGVASLLTRRESGPIKGREPTLNRDDALLFGEIFWDLFREGVVTLGCDASNRNYPFFRVSSFGKRILEQHNTYFFHDVSTYEALVRGMVPSIDGTTMLYVKEAMQAFRAGCMLSATVMLGVATEHTFLKVLDTAEKNSPHGSGFTAAGKERSILPKANRFKAALDKLLPHLPPEVKEDLDTRFAGILSIIRNFRNESGHPTGKIVDREQVYVLLNLFPPYCHKMYQLIQFFS